MRRKIFTNNINMNRIHATGIALALLLATSAAAQNRSANGYPSKPIRLVSGQQGSPSDSLARIIAAGFGERWGQPVVVENRPGAAGMIGANIVAKAPPDGYTLLVISAQFAILAALQSNLPYDPVRDFSGVTQLSYSTSALRAGTAR
jgi:tripartite-type tricarboxylate transporter receptor subunit TctC